MSRLSVLPLVLALSLAGAATAAETHDPRFSMPPSINDRFEKLIDRLLDRVEPGLDALGDMLGDLSGWHAPEILPNGDILIRRRAQPPAPYKSPPPEAEEPPVTDPFEL